MTKKIKKGMILAAGLGTRLRPITYHTPKPMLQVGDRNVIEYNLALFEKSGIKDIVINLHYLSDLIKARLGDGSKYGVNITYSYEPEILGTGGGIKKAEEFFGGEPFIVTNSDVITDIDLKDVFEFHLARDASATLVLRSLGEKEVYTPILVDNDRVIEFGSGDMMYTGIQIIDPSVLKRLPQGIFSDIVSEAYVPLLKNGGRISAYIHDGFWTEIGTQRKLDKARKLIESNKIDLWYL